jgi:PncC family amidohydrolase
MFTNISGASDVFERAIVCYSNDSKIQLLNVDPNSIKGEGAVSETVAKQLAHNMRVLSNVDVGVGITGIAGPTGGTKDKPIGLVYVAFSTEHQLVTKRYQFETDRVDFKKKVLDAILETLESLLKSWSA